jgi:hypothetical protein
MTTDRFANNWRRVSHRLMQELPWLRMLEEPHHRVHLKIGCRRPTLRMTGNQISPAEATTTDRFANNWRRVSHRLMQEKPLCPNNIDCRRPALRMLRGLKIIVVRCYFLRSSGRMNHQPHHKEVMRRMHSEKKCKS